MMREKVRIVDSAIETAKEVEFNLTNKSLLNLRKQKGEFSFFVSDDPNKFQQLGSIFLGHQITGVEEKHF